MFLDGPGHVIAHNAIAYFHDALGISTYGTPEKDPELQASSTDIYGNDTHMSNDDVLETDGSVHNVRVFNNRGINAAQGGAHVTFTQDTWEHIYQIKDKEYPDAKIVGWYHTHPSMGVFLSHYDTWLHSNFFPEPWQVALVVEPVTATGGP